MRRVAGGGEAVEPEHACADDVHVLRRHRRELAPERVERVAVQPARAALEPRRVDEVRRADLGDVHLERGMLAHEHARRAGVVEVDVAQQQVPDVGELQPARGQPGLQRLDRRARAAVEQRRPVVRLEEVRRDRPLRAVMVQVDRLELAHDAILRTARVYL